MRIIEVTRLKTDKHIPPMAEVSARLDELGEGHEIGTVNWQSHTYRPEVRFNIA